MLSINPKMLPRLDELEEGLLARRQRAINEGWRGEVEGLELDVLRSKRDQARRTAVMGTVSLGMPVMPKSHRLEPLRQRQRIAVVAALRNPVVSCRRIPRDTSVHSIAVLVLMWPPPSATSVAHEHRPSTRPLTLGNAVANARDHFRARHKQQTTGTRRAIPVQK